MIPIVFPVMHRNLFPKLLSKVLLITALLSGCRYYPDRLRKDLLEQYGFLSHEYSFRYAEITEGTGPLLGNTEMGGKPLASGLGMPETWFAGYWRDEQARQSIPGPAFQCNEYHSNPVTFSRHLNIANGVLSTMAQYQNGAAYEAKMFFSHARRDLLVIELRNTSKDSDASIELQYPREGFSLQKKDERTITGISEGYPYTRMAWAVNLDRPLNGDGQNLVIKPGESLELRFGFAVHWDGENIGERANEALQLQKDIQVLYAENEKAWRSEWDSTAVIVLPDKDYEQLYYRSIYWMLSTAGSRKFLPGEVMFSVPTWKMHAFTYGGGGWPVFAYTYLGLPGHARRMLDWHFKPEAFISNAARYTEPGRENTEVWSFAHELSTEGHEIAAEPWYSQRHIEGFAAAFFNRFNEYYPDPEFEKDILWPVLRGTAEFWRSVVLIDEATGAYLLPEFLSVSENIREISVLDAVLSAKYCLGMAAAYADAHALDEGLVAEWRKIEEGLLIPHNEEIYLQFPGLTREAMQELGGGYFGYRAPMYLGFPLLELNKILDSEKVGKTLDEAWLANGKGKDMITFIASWFALADIFHGRGDHALEVMGRNLECMPEALAENLPESGHIPNPYYLDSYAAFTIIPLKMLLQSFGDTIRPFPSLPSSWKDVSFYNVPAEEGIRVSGEMRNGNVSYVEYSKAGRRLLRLNGAGRVHIRGKGGNIELNPIIQ